MLRESKHIKVHKNDVGLNLNLAFYESPVGFLRLQVKICDLTLERKFDLRGIQAKWEKAVVG